MNLKIMGRTIKMSAKIDDYGSIDTRYGANTDDISVTLGEQTLYFSGVTIKEALKNGFAVTKIYQLIED
jgi:hypothetical protein